MVGKWNTAFLEALRVELSKTHKMPIKGDVSVLDTLLNKMRLLKDLSSLHLEALTNFQKSSPHVDFPELHKELFSKMEKIV